MKVFKTVTGEAVDIVEHTLSYLKEHPTGVIHIGTDSQNIHWATVYVTVIAYRSGIRGAHYIYYKEVVPKIKDMWTRLFKETMLSIEVADWVKAQVNVPLTIDMDFNEDEYYDSNKLISASKGWAISLGYQVNCKPSMTIACKAADHHCRSVKVSRRRKKKKLRDK